MYDSRVDFFKTDAWIHDYSAFARFSHSGMFIADIKGKG